MTTNNIDDGAAGHNPAARPSLSRDRLLIDLGGEIRAMRTELGTTTGTVKGLLRDMSEIWGPDLVTLQTMVGTLRGEVDVLLAPDGENEEEDSPGLHWPELTTEEAGTAWRELGEWVEEILGHWFEVRRGQLPDCWALHRPALMHLWTLRLVYVDAHQGPNASAVKMAEWDQRWLDGTLGKISDAIPESLCRPRSNAQGQHMVPRQEAESGAAQREPATPTRSAPSGPAPSQRDLDAARAAVQRRATERAPVVDPGRNAAQVAAQSFAAPLAPQQPAASPYSIPAYANAAADAGAGDVEVTSPSAEPRSEWRGVEAKNEPISSRYWSAYFQRARDADLARRRERDARTAESDD